MIKDLYVKWLSLLNQQPFPYLTKRIQSTSGDWIRRYHTTDPWYYLRTDRLGREITLNFLLDFKIQNIQ